LEINYNHKLPELNWIIQYKNTPGVNDFVFGSDVHSIEQLRLHVFIKERYFQFGMKVRKLTLWIG